MQFAKIIFIFKILSSEVFGEASFTHIGDSLIQCKPIQFPHKFLDVFPIEITGSVDALLHLNDQREVVLLAFGNVAYEKVVR